MKNILVGLALAAALTLPVRAAEPTPVSQRTTDEPITVITAEPLNVLTHGPAPTLGAILTAEFAFEAMSEKEGAAKAFRAYMDADDGLEFVGKGEPVRGAEAIFKAQGGITPPTTTLHWTPVEAFASTGDMGVVWGHWRLTKVGDDKAIMTGKYVTVWRQNAKGEWKAIVDIGNPD